MAKGRGKTKFDRCNSAHMQDIARLKKRIGILENTAKNKRRLEQEFRSFVDMLKASGRTTKEELSLFFKRK